MKITISKYAGFCEGVRRAVEMIENLPKTMPQPIYMLGSLVHNEFVVKKLLKRGIKIIDSIDRLKQGTLIISAHGVDPKIITKAKKQSLVVVDTTCPKVLTPHQLIKILKKEGYTVFIFGDKNHIEVKGISAEINHQAYVLNSESEIKNFPWHKFKKIGILSQTTQDVEKFYKFVNFVRKKCQEVKVFDTICDSTRFRQADVKKLAQENDLVLIIGSSTSANTKRLYEIAKAINPKTYRIATPYDLKKKWFSKVKRVGISAGASTPKEIIEGVIKKLKTFG